MYHANINQRKAKSGYINIKANKIITEGRLYIDKRVTPSRTHHSNNRTTLLKNI